LEAAGIPQIQQRWIEKFFQFTARVGMAPMIVLRWRVLIVLALAFPGAAFLSGCGDGTPSMDTSLTEAVISGVVSVKGLPATGGTILFNPSNAGRIVPTRSAPIGPDGTYTIKTLTGVNQVSFEGEVATKNRGVGLLKDFAEVTSGTNQKNFDLMGENGGKKIQLPADGKRVVNKASKWPPPK
jgi:hypothetical protein